MSEWEALAVAREVADVLAAAGIAIRGEDETVRSVIGVEPHPWPVGLSAAMAQELASAEHILVPKSVPQTPDLGQDYSPN